MKKYKTIIRRALVYFGIFSQARKIVFWLRGSRQDEMDQNFLQNLINPGDLVFDVGANRGQSAEAFLRAGAKVVSFEPQTELHQEIRQICRGLGDLLIDSDGLGSKVETKRFFKKEYDQVASFREDWEGIPSGETIVHISTLDYKIKKYGQPNYIKIDVEGWELEVLKGLSFPVPIISFEYHIRDTEIELAKAVMEQIQKLGNYDFNIRLPWEPKFAMDKNLPSESFRNFFPDNLSIPSHCGYGDVFCFLRSDM